MTNRRRRLELTPSERREIAALLETMRADLGDAARDALSDLTALTENWSEVVELFPKNGSAPAASRPDPIPAPQPTGLETMSRADVARLLKASVSTIQRMEKDGRLPKPIKTGPRMRRHLVKDVNDLIERLEADRDSQHRGRLH